MSDNLSFLSSFVFKEVVYRDYHYGNLMFGVKYHHIMYLKKGTAEIVTNDEKIMLSEGDLLFIHRGARYSAYMHGTPDICFDSYAFLNFPETGNADYRIQKIQKNEVIDRLVMELSDNISISSTTLGNFYLLLGKLLEFMKPAVLDRKQAMFEKLVSLIIENPDCVISTVAKDCYMSVSGMYELFREMADTTPAKFKMEVRLERALYYVISTDMPIEEISNVCGFSSSSYFRKKFFDKYKKTPSRVRNEYKKNRDFMIDVIPKG